MVPQSPELQHVKQKTTTCRTAVKVSNLATLLCLAFVCQPIVLLLIVHAYGISKAKLR